MSRQTAAESVGRSGLERRVLDLVGTLVLELGGGAPRALTPDVSLDRDLGLGSLERVELLLRLEQEFGIRLADAVLAEAQTPRDLVRAIGQAGPARGDAVPEARRPAGPGIAAPPETRTLMEALRWHVETHPDRVHIVLQEDDERETPITYRALWEGATAIATGLRDGGLAGDQAVALMLRTERAFFDTFFGVLLAGGVPVPIYPPFRLDRLEEYAARQVAILTNAEARLLVTFGPAARVARLLEGRVPSLHGVTTPERLGRPGAQRATVSRASERPALIQYTSGSTGAPRGVLLSHANVLANIRAIGEAIAIGPADVGVSWLPLYHDMGLIGTWLASLHFGIPVVILSPLAFLSRPARWLRAIHAHRATLSAAPNFAFDLCVRKVDPAEIEGLDLHTWRLAFNGSEPVSPETIERFTRRFAPYGFRREAMCPVYGLAESSVALTVPPLGRGPWIDRVGREVFARCREARVASPDDANPLRFVSCGRPLPGHEVRVVDAAEKPVGERIEGRVEFRGPSVTSGYFRNPEATRAAHRGAWMDSGDLGYQVAGELFLTGRQKDVVIKAGRNLYPQEVEEIVGDVPGIRTGCVAAFGVADSGSGTERLVVVAESRETAPERLEALRAAVLDRVVTGLGIPADVVVIAAPGAVLKTSSGKIRRSATRDAYAANVLGRRPASAAAQWTRLVVRDVAARVGRVLEAATTLPYAGYVGALLLVLVPSLWALLLVVPRGRVADRVVRVWCRALLRASGCRVRVEGREHLREAAPAILAANHASYLDAVVLLAALPVEFAFVAKGELTRWPVVGTVVRKTGQVLVDRADAARSAAAARRATGRLGEGRSVLFFPEGTFVAGRGLLPFRLGAFKAAVDAARPVVPIGLHGTREILPAGTWRPTRGPITVVIGRPIAPHADGWQEIVRLRDLARAAIVRLAREHQAPETSAA